MGFSVIILFKSLLHVFCSLVFSAHNSSVSHPKHFLKTSFIKLILSRVRSRVYSRLYSQERYQLPVKTNQLAQIIQVGYNGHGCADDDDDVEEEDGDACSRRKIWGTMSHSPENSSDLSDWRAIQSNEEQRLVKKSQSRKEASIIFLPPQIAEMPANRRRNRWIVIS